MPNLRVLIVDDEPSVLEFLGGVLEEAGYEVRGVEDGEKALEQVESFMPHIVLLDVMMPGMNGMDALVRIREIDTRAKVIMISGMMDLATARAALKMGAVEYITKPINTESLLAFLEKLSEDFQ